MKRTILLLLLSNLFFVSVYSQNKELKGQRLISFQDQKEILNDTVSNFFVNKLNLNINNYKIVSLSRIVSVSDSLTLIKQSNLVRLVHIKYSNLNSVIIEYNRTKEVFNCDLKRTIVQKPKVRLMSVYKTTEPDENGKYSITFYSVEE